MGTLQYTATTLSTFPGSLFYWLHSTDTPRYAEEATSAAWLLWWSLLFYLCTAAAPDQNQQEGDNDVSLLVNGLPSHQERNNDPQDLSAMVFIVLFMSFVICVCVPPSSFASSSATFSSTCRPASLSPPPPSPPSSSSSSCRRWGGIWLIACHNS